MKAKNEIILFEYDCLVNERELGGKRVPSSIHVVTDRAYQYLKQLCLSEESERNLLQLRRRCGLEVLQVQNYAGVIFTPDRTQIEVLPKLGKSFKEDDDGRLNAHEKARQSLLIMLKSLKGFAHVQTSNANIDKQKMPLLEVFISQFLQSVNDLVKRGLRSDYVRREDNLSYLKGKLNIGKQLRHNAVNKHHFYCEYDEFQLDRPANRLIHAALKKAKSLTQSANNQKLLQELEFVFHEVPESYDPKLDFAKLNLNRGMIYYQASLDWCKLILEGFSPQTMKGSNYAASLLFPMEKVFEDYVAKHLKSKLTSSHPLLNVITQAKGRFLASYDGMNKFSLRPDLLITEGKQNRMVLDTKWKLLDVSLTNANVSQSDVYQLFAYAKKYLPGERGDVVLIYPSQDNFDQPLPHSFDLGEQHKLWVVPFVIGRPGEARFVVPDELELLRSK